MKKSSVSTCIQSALAIVLLQLCVGFAVADESAGIDFELPTGFSVTVLVEGVANARSLALGAQETVFVSTRKLGKLYAVTQAFSAEPKVLTIASGLDMPNGIAFFEGDLYVAEARKILRFADVEDRLGQLGESTVIADLPYESRMHAWRYIGFGPDRKLYVSLGAPCNVCDASEHTVMLRMNADGSGREVFARGIRNSVGFDWHPESDDLWFTDNGRDLLGDDVPPDELNRADRMGLDFGFPYCHGVDIVDPELGASGRCADAVPVAQALDPHAAALGMRFYTGRMFPEGYRRQIFVAEHGSWNRSKLAGKTGYRISLVRLDGNRPISYELFMGGFMQVDQKVLGRPVDVLVAPDGALLVSDDRRGMIYRVAYGEQD